MFKSVCSKNKQTNKNNLGGKSLVAVAGKILVL